MRIRMTLTVSRSAAAALDALARETGQNRSRAAEALIQESLHRRRERALERLAARFFSEGPSKEEQAERGAWDRVAMEAFHDDEESPRRAAAR